MTTKSLSNFKITIFWTISWTILGQFCGQLCGQLCRQFCSEFQWQFRDNFVGNFGVNSWTIFWTVFRTISGQFVEHLIKLLEYLTLKCFKLQECVFSYFPKVILVTTEGLSSFNITNWGGVLASVDHLELWSPGLSSNIFLKL